MTTEMSVARSINQSINQSIDQLIQINVYLPHSMFSYSSIIPNNLGAEALNKPYCTYMYKESSWYINLLINYSELCPICS